MTGEIKEDAYDILVLATGAYPMTPPPFNSKTYDNVFQVRTIQDNRDISSYMTQHQPKNAVIVGSGFIGLEMTEQLVHKGMNVTLIELQGQVMPPMDADMAFRVEEHLREKGVNLLLNDTVSTIDGEDSIKRVTTTNGEVIDADIVFLAVGVRPNIELAEQIGVEIGQTGAIAVDKQMRTNVPDVYAVGDVAESFSVITGKPIYRPLGSTANKMGRIAGDIITGGDLEHRGVLGTGIFRIFDMHVAQTGLTEKEAEGYDIAILYNIRPDHAEYLGGKELTIKAIADQKTEKVLGAQITGQGGVDKRIDVLATAITFGAKAEDLFHLDLAYAPPFSTTKDPILYTGMALDNAIHGVPLITPKQLIERQEQGEKIQIIDTRSRKDYEKSHVKGALHIGLYDLKSRLNELDRDLPTVTYCNKGVTGNAAQNLLLNNGFKEVYNISGTDIESLGNIPKNIEVEERIDQLAVLDQAHIFLTHSGMNSISESLYFAVPSVLAPLHSEEEMIAERVQEMGAGTPLASQDVEGIQEAVKELLNNPLYKENAEKVSRTFKKAGGSEAAADIIEKVI